MIPLPNPTKILEKNDTNATFQIESLYPGYGITIGNSLRRILLSSLEGAAVTEARIKGVAHEFSTIPGVLEDVVSILLHIKQLRFRMDTNEPQKATLKVKGEKTVKGADFKCPPQVKLVNPELVIAHLTDRKAELEIEILIEKGMGYVPAEVRKKEKQEIGAVSLDAAFSPVRRVSYRVENMRVGERTDFDRLIMEVQTDGTIDPVQAFKEAAEILMSQFEAVASGLPVERARKEEKEKEPAKVVKEKKGERKTTQKTQKKKKSK